MGKLLLDINDDALATARAELGTTTIEHTVNGALRVVAARREHRVAKALDVLAAIVPGDRFDAWR